MPHSIAAAVTTAILLIFGYAMMIAIVRYRSLAASSASTDDTPRLMMISRSTLGRDAEAGPRYAECGEMSFSAIAAAAQRDAIPLHRPSFVACRWRRAATLH